MLMCSYRDSFSLNELNITNLPLEKIQRRPLLESDSKSTKNAIHFYLGVITLMHFCNKVYKTRCLFYVLVYEMCVYV